MLMVLCRFSPNSTRRAKISSTLSTTSGTRWQIINPASLRLDHIHHTSVKTVSKSLIFTRSFPIFIKWAAVHTQMFNDHLFRNIMDLADRQCDATLLFQEICVSFACVKILSEVFGVRGKVIDGLPPETECM